MPRRFNVTGSCNPKFHYMVDITGRLKKIRELIDNGSYFTVNRARQYGKTTTLSALADYLKNDYMVVLLDFQMLGNADFSTEIVFARAFVRYLLRTIRNKRKPIKGFEKSRLDKLERAAQTEEQFSLGRLFELLSDLCDTAQMPVVLIVDEVDSATNNQVFLDFLAQLRAYYLNREILPTFQSVILAGVVDVKNVKIKIRTDQEHKTNSPWNIATDFLVDMSFDREDIKGMLEQYEDDYETGMDLDEMAGLIYASTSGYPFLVSRICQLLDERVAGSERFPYRAEAWTKAGYIEAEKILTHEKNTLFESLTGKLEDYPELAQMLKAILFNGLPMSYAAGNQAIEVASMFGFVKNVDGNLAVANRIFETYLYNLFLSEEEVSSAVYATAVTDKYQFIKGGHLDMELVLERFVKTFAELYKDESEKFKEEIGRKYFMLFLRPIINGTGRSYVEARTRDMKRTDIIVDYGGEQFVIELKIWRGSKYHAAGEAQIAEYLEYYELKTGYMLTFSFSQNKEIGVKRIRYGDRVLVEAVV